MFRFIYLITGLFVAFIHTTFAEPYLAARTGHKCMACHVSPSGGGMRTEFGQIYGRSLASSATDAPVFSASLSDNIRMGGDFRGGFQSSQTPGEDNQNSFDTKRANIYLNAQLIENLSFYVDQQLAPANENRAAWIKYQSSDYYLRAGQFFIPYGLRLEDDTAFIRQITGINFASADNGIELGWDINNWSSQFSLTNGTAGATENNEDKQASIRLAYITPTWRLGMSLNNNKSPTVSREMFNLFAMFNFWQAEWLFEIDQIRDTETQTLTRQLLFFEVNKEIIKGHNLKLTLEFDDPDSEIDEDERTRNSLVWEHFPRPHLQIRTGFRDSEGIPQKPQDNLNEFFVNLHAWF